MKRRIIAILLCASLFSGLTACSWVENIGNPEPSTQPTTESVEPTTTEAVVVPEAPLDIIPEAPKPTTDAKELYAALAAAGSVPSFADPFEKTEDVAVHFENEAEKCLLQDDLFVAMTKYEVLLFGASGSSSSQKGVISFSVNPSENYQEFTNDIFLFGDHLTVVTTVSSFSSNQNTFTRSKLYCYDVSNPYDPRLKAEFTQDGSYVGGVTDGSTLYLISSVEPQPDAAGVAFPAVSDGEGTASISPILLSQQCDELRFTVAASYSMADGSRLGVTALTDRYDHFAVLDGSLFLARDASLSAESESYTIEPYTVRDCLSGCFTELLSFDAQLRLVGNTCIPGAPLKLSASDSLYLVSTVSSSEYSLFTDETYGWTNRLDKETQCSQQFTSLSSDLTVRYETELPSVAIDNVLFSDNMALLAMNSTSFPLCIVDLADGASTSVSVLPSANNRIFTDGSSVYVLSAEENDLFISTLQKDGTLGGHTRVGVVSYGAVMFADGSGRIAVSYDGHTRVLTPEPMELGSVGITGITSYAMNDTHLYAYAVSRLHVIDLEDMDRVAEIKIEFGD